MVKYDREFKAERSGIRCHTYRGSRMIDWFFESIHDSVILLYVFFFFLSSSHFEHTQTPKVDVSVASFEAHNSLHSLRWPHRIQNHSIVNLLLICHDCHFGHTFSLNFASAIDVFFCSVSVNGKSAFG